MQLSKSEYMMYLKHPVWVWLKKHDKKKLPEIGANQQAMFDAGHDFEQYAEALFEDGVTLGFDSYDEYLSLPPRTQEALNSDVSTIFQGRIEAKNCTFIFDILHRVSEDEFDLYEIKSSTKVKEDHYYDLAFQLHVAQLAGLNIRSIYVIHVNNNYVRSGEVKPKAITVTEEVSDRVRLLQDETEQNIAAAWDVIGQAAMPDPSPRYAGLSGFRDYMEIYSNLKNIPPESIYNLYGLDAKLCAQLEDERVEAIHEIPKHINLKPKQQWQVMAAKAGEPIVKTDKVEKFLNSFRYPLYFLDYETLADMVPPFAGLKPYQQLPFQYSLHVLREPSGKLEHYDYLHTDQTNPVEPLVEQLEKEIGSEGSILVWSKRFEQGCNDLMGSLFPRYKDVLEAINQRIVDLMDPFAYGWYIDQRFVGSASIKNVLPVLAPDLSYKELEVQEGGSAQRLWMDAVLRDKYSGDQDKLLQNLRQYCELDTLAMVRIFEFLKNQEFPTSSNSPEEPEQTSLF